MLIEYVIERQQKLRQLLNQNDFKAVILNPGPDLTYFTGLHFHLMERPILGIFPVEGSPVIVLPELEGAKLNSIDYDVRPFFFSEDQSSWSGVIKDALTTAEIKSGNLGVIPRHLRMLEFNFIKEAYPDLNLISAQKIIDLLRMVKGEYEIEMMQEAVRIAECALSATISSIKPGTTEKKVASKLVNQLLHHGSDPQLPFFPIVAFGPNTANPHAAPTDRELKIGDLVLIDWGANWGGYFSDITRTFAMGDINPELEQIASFVLKANEAGRSKIKEGVSAKSVDQAAREIINQAGYGDYFIHRTGHGLGREIHEEPYISQFEMTKLEPGMTFTVEPGIYLPNRGGVRIEDDVVVTKDSCISLTKLPRELSQLLIED